MSEVRVKPRVSANSITTGMRAGPAAAADFFAAIADSPLFPPWSNPGRFRRI
jgi:hypothetical protein